MTDAIFSPSPENEKARMKFLKEMGPGRIELAPYYKTLRDEFAMAALIGGRKPSDVGAGLTCEEMAKGCYQLADAFLAERAREKE